MVQLRTVVWPKYPVPASLLSLSLENNLQYSVSIKHCGRRGKEKMHSTNQPWQVQPTITFIYKKCPHSTIILIRINLGINQFRLFQARIKILIKNDWRYNI